VSQHDNFEPEAAIKITQKIRQLIHERL